MIAIEIKPGQKIRVLCCAWASVKFPEEPPPTQNLHGVHVSRLKYDIMEVVVKEIVHGEVIIGERGERIPLIPETERDHIWVILLGNDN